MQGVSPLFPISSPVYKCCTQSSLKYMLHSKQQPPRSMRGKNELTRLAISSIHALQESAQVYAIMAGWEAAAGGNTTLFCPVAWDWRSDLFEQSNCVSDMVLHAKQESCTPHHHPFPLPQELVSPCCDPCCAMHSEVGSVRYSMSLAGV